MKKLFSMILALCLLLSAFAAFADDVDYKADYAAKITKLADSMRAYYEASGETEKIESVSFDDAFDHFIV